MLCKCHSIVLYTVNFTTFCLGGPFFPGHGVLSVYYTIRLSVRLSVTRVDQSKTVDVSVCYRRRQTVSNYSEQCCVHVL